MIHHCIGPNPDHGVYRSMSEPVRAASAFLSDMSVAAEEIDVHHDGDILIVESHHNVCLDVKTSLYLFAAGHGLGTFGCDTIGETFRLEPSKDRIC